MSDVTPAVDALLAPEADSELDDVVSEWTNVPDVAQKLGIELSKVRQLIKDGHLLAVRRKGVQAIPADLVANSEVMRFLPGVITLMRDGHYSDEEIVRWLYRPDDSLVGGSCIAELVAGRGTEIKRRAQAAGL